MVNLISLRPGGEDVLETPDEPPAPAPAPAHVPRADRALSADGGEEPRVVRVRDERRHRLGVRTLDGVEEGSGFAAPYLNIFCHHIVDIEVVCYHLFILCFC